MRRPAIITITTIGAAAAAAAALATTSPANPAGPPTGELHLVGRPGSVTLVDNPPRQHGRHHPPSRGDGFVMTETVFDPASGDRIGRTQTACTVIDARHGRLQCTGTIVLPQGEIAVQGDGQPPFAVTGGTGAFAGARGTLDGSEHDGRIDVTVHFAN
jgi:hypothetical protein